ncbi:MAG TPA: competence/damage-inducible protein A, partial [Chondromyces sp.]|nr:competence/damage-inducible protein A [Chondromyces sp.]
MNAEIIAVGTELLLGQIANTNAQFISHHLAEIGINVYYHTAVGDNPERLIAAVKAAEERADLLIFTGGLGPTKDDLTKEAIAKHLGKELVMDEAALHSIEQYFIQTGRNMTENNKKQALVLQDAAVLPNDFGMAPGMFLQSGHMKYMLLPGPPSEMQPMFVRYGKAELLKLMEKVERIESRVLRFFGIGESALEVEVEDLIENQTNPTIAPLAGDGEVTLRLTAKHESEDEALRLIQEVEDEIQRRVGEYFYGYENTTIVKELVKALKTKGESVAVAESLTGGLFQSELTSISGVSAVFKGGIICYSNEIKQQTL